MDSRKALDNRSLVLSYKNGNEKQYTICREVGRGGSSIAYYAEYINNQGDPIPVYIKECYPYALKINRDADGALVPEIDSEEPFRQYKERIAYAFRNNTKLFRNTDLTNEISSPDDIFYANNTVYTVSRFLRGETLAEERELTVHDAVEIVRNTAEIIGHIHKEGYLYLDIKPGNVWAVKGESTFVQLLDFDSLMPLDISKRSGDYSDLGIGYTSGFAPIEQIQERTEELGPWSDIYSLGALLFYLLFGRSPTAFDCRLTSRYDYESSICRGKRYQDKLFRRLDRVFHKSLASYYKDRYSNCSELIEALDSLIEYSREKKIFVSSSSFGNMPYCEGRIKELTELRKWVDSDSRCLIVHGMDGLGKTTLVRRFMIENRESFGKVFYLTYSGSFESTFNDDQQLNINTVSRDADETDKQYFSRKSAIFKEITDSETVILVIDNYLGEVEESILDLASDNRKIIIVTKENRRDERLDQLELGEICSQDDLRSIFVHYSGVDVSNDNKDMIDAIIDNTFRNTLLIELCARQIKYNHFPLEEMFARITVGGVSDSVTDRVKVTIDNRPRYTSVPELMGDLYSIENRDMSDTKKGLLMTAAVFGLHGISYSDFREFVPEMNMSEVNELMDEGWITASDIVTVHPLIRAALETISLKENIWNTVVSATYCLFATLAVYCEKQKTSYTKAIEYVKINEKVSSDEIRKYCKDTGNSELMAVYLQKLVNEDYSKPVNIKKLSRLIKYAESYLDFYSKNEMIRNSHLYIQTECYVVCSLEFDKEANMVSYTHHIIAHVMLVPEPLFMDVLEKLTDLYLYKGDFESAKQYIDTACNYAISSKSKYAKGRYYDSVAAYIDESMDPGNYYLEDRDDLLGALDKALFNMKRAKTADAPLYCSRYLLSKANVMMRTGGFSVRLIKHIFEQAEKILDRESLPISKEIFEYDMVKARFFTDIQPDYICTVALVNDARDRIDTLLMSDIEKINQFYIPAANLYYDHEKYAMAEDLITDAIDICNQHKEIAVYEIKRRELIQIQTEIRNNY